MKIWAKTKEFFEGKFLVVRRDGTVPKWPHFVLGGRDPYAPAALRAYAKAYDADGGTDQEYSNSIRELAGDFEQYNAEHGHGDPESGPHRVDNVNVILAMRNPGCAVGLTVERLPGK